MTTKRLKASADETAAMQPASMMQVQLDGFMGLVREAAANPQIDVEKLKTLMDMQQRVLDKAAEQEFTISMNEAQATMGMVVVNKRNPQTNSRYATYDQLDRALRPIYTDNGFSVSFNTGQGDDPNPIPPEHIRIWMLLSHKGGYTRPYHVDMPNDGKGARGGDVMTKTHATGAGMSYGMRYLLKMAFNVAIGEEDDDGNGGRPGGGKDHRFQNMSKSARKEAKEKEEETEEQDGEAETEPSGDAREKFPGVVKAKAASDRIMSSNLRTVRSNMSRLKVTERQFFEEFGFKLDELDKHGLNDMLDWMKEASK